jgi:hypothetical protein
MVSVVAHVRSSNTQVQPQSQTSHRACVYTFVFGVGAFWFWNVAACYTVSVSLCVWPFRRYMAVSCVC